MHGTSFLLYHIIPLADCLSTGWHVTRPTVAQIPVRIIHKLETGQRELFLYQFCQLFLDWFGPVSDKHNKLIDTPCYSATGYLCIITTELCLQVFGLCAEILFCPHLSVKVWIVDKRHPFIRCFFHLLWCQFHLTDTEKRMVLRVVPKNAHARHLFVERLHVGHLSRMF